MSKRFGRNQRRRAREAMAQLTSERDSINHAYWQQVELGQRLNTRWRAAQEELDDAKDIAGRMSHLFPARDEMNASHRKPPAHGDMFMVDIRSRLQDLPQFVGNEPPAAASYRREPLALLLARIEPEALSYSAQVRVRFANNEVAYGITPAAWHSLNRNQRFDRLSKEIAPALAKLLVETTDLRRYG